MTGEYWAGWFDHWGEKHHDTDGAKEAAEFEWMLSQGYSVSMYMFHGGTSFGWMNGANSNGTNYEPDTTSYDYDAPLDEQGKPRQKYYLFRDAIARVTGHTAAPSRRQSPRMTFPIDSANRISLVVEQPAQARRVRHAAHHGRHGPVVRIHALSHSPRGQARAANWCIDGLHDYAQVYVDQKLIGTLDRRLAASHLKLPANRRSATLDILVENTGRVNFTKVIRGERKGITGKVTLAGKEPKHWQIFSLAHGQLGQMQLCSEPCEGPCFHRTTFAASEPADTYVDTTALHKGMMWINQRPLGRFWSIGPQHTLFLPAPWLQQGTERDCLLRSPERAFTVAQNHRQANLRQGARAS